MNNVTLIGRLSRDPQFAYTPTNNMAVFKMNVAVDRPRRNGEDAGADFINVTVWGRQAETCDRYLKKGRQVAVTGRIQTGSYKNRDGQNVYTTEVVADRVEFLGGNNQDTKAQPVATAETDKVIAEIERSFEGVPFQVAEDDIPF